MPSSVVRGDYENEPPRAGLTGMTLDELENAAVKEVLAETGGNKSEAARRLGITRKTLQSKLQKMDADTEE